ncbi:MAG: hypothetical protein IPP68_04575 [Elusimicrobia bacterium]|nr:hypothetical protein [Elusimicrobiota bacterium]
MINDPRLALQSLLAPPQHAHTRAGFSVATGPSGLVQWALPVLAANLPLYERVLWVDTSGRFDPRPLLQQADDWGIDRFFYLNRIQVAQPRSSDHLERFIVSELLPRSAGDQPVVIADPFHLWDIDGFGPTEKEDRFLRFEDLMANLLPRCLVLSEERRSHMSGFNQRLFVQAARRARMEIKDGFWSVLELSEKLSTTVKNPA